MFELWITWILLPRSIIYQLNKKYFTDFLFIPPKKILLWGIIASAKYLEKWIFLYVSVLL